MQGEITLDETYESGMEGYPGTRFVIKLNTPAILLDSIDIMLSNLSKVETSLTQYDDLSMHKKSCLHDKIPSELPENLSVLFVDDDALLRKLSSIHAKANAGKLRKS
jgi:hypothetical protein